MSASDNIHRMQMKLFVNPEEHIDSLVGSVDLPWHGGGEESWNRLWGQKTREAALPTSSGEHGSGVKASIAERGFQHSGAPTLYAADDFSGFVQEEGHHRIAASAALQRETGKAHWVPVRYSSLTFTPNRGGIKPAPHVWETDSSSGVG